MSDSLQKLMEAAKEVRMSPADQEEQRQSFAYGNTKIENELIDKEIVAKQSEALKSEES